MRRGTEHVGALFAVSAFFNAKQRREQTEREHGKRAQRACKNSKKGSSLVQHPIFTDFQHYATLGSENRRNQSFCLKTLIGTCSPCAPACSHGDCQFVVLFDVFPLGLAVFTSPRSCLLQFWILFRHHPKDRNLLYSWHHV